MVSLEPPLSFQEHNGAFWTLQKLGLGGAHFAGVRDDIEIGKHHGKGFIFPDLAAPKAAHGAFIRGEHREMKATQPFDSENRPLLQVRDGLSDRRLALGKPFARGRLKPHLRPTIPAGIGLSMETPVPRVVVFSLTRRTHAEASHGGLVAVIGDIFDDSVAWAAVGAVDKGIAVTAIEGITELMKAVGTGADIGSDQRGARVLPSALDDMETIEGTKGPFRNLDLYDPGKRRRFGGDVPNECFDFLRCSRHLNFDAIRLIPDPAVELVLMGQLENEGPETHALDNASDANEDAAISRTRIRIRADTLLRS